MQIKNKKYKAFSFVEVMISVFVLSVGMIAIITLMSGSLRDSLDSRNQIIASGLAQEGTELVKNIRDTNWLVYTDPGYSFADITSGSTCKIDKGSGLVCDGTLKQLNIDNNGYYVHSAGTASKYYRNISVVPSGANRAVISMVIWGGSTFPADTSTCNTSTKCAFAQLTLTTYGE